MSWIVFSVGVSFCESPVEAEEMAAAAATVSGKGSAGLSTLPLGLSGMRARGTKTTKGNRSGRE